MSQIEVPAGGFTQRLARFALEHSLGGMPSPIKDVSINMMINAAAAALACVAAALYLSDSLDQD